MLRQGYESSCCSDEEDEEEDEVLALAKGVLRHKRVQRIHSGTHTFHMCLRPSQLKR